MRRPVRMDIDGLAYQGLHVGRFFLHKAVVSVSVSLHRHTLHLPCGGTPQILSYFLAVMQIVCVFRLATDSSVQSHQIVVPWLSRNHSRDCLSARLSVCHLLRVYGKGAPGTVRVKSRVCRLKSSGTVCLQTDIWHRDE